MNKMYLHVFFPLEIYDKTDENDSFSEAWITVTYEPLYLM